MLLLSQSSLATYMRCRKKYYYEYELLLDTPTRSEAMEAGSDFHAIMAGVAHGEYTPVFDASPMDAVAASYLEHRGFPAEVVMAETPIWTRLGTEDIWIRSTPDLVFKDESGWITVRDYKTFEKYPTLDMDLDFQGKLYSALLRAKYGPNVMFEYEYVRRTPPYVAKDKRGGFWTPDECYLTVPVYANDVELEILMLEAIQVARDIQATQKSRHWYRQPIKGNQPGGCGSCPMKVICKKDLEQGGLTEDDIEIHTVPREPLTLPESL